MHIKVLRLFPLLTPMKNNRDHILTKMYLHTYFEVQATFISSDIVFKMFSGFDLC